MNSYGPKTMISRYTKRIEEYCRQHGFSVPVGFYRHPAFPLVVVRTDSVPPKLVALTWPIREHVVRYIESKVLHETSSGAPPVRIFDFENHEELVYTDSKHLSRKCDLEGNP